jgi:hypothetical protein
LPNNLGQRWGSHPRNAYRDSPAFIDNLSRDARPMTAEPALFPPDQQINLSRGPRARALL